MTRNAAQSLSAPPLPDSDEDGWDMPPRREGQVMGEPQRPFEAAAPDRPLPTARGLLSPAELEALLRPDLSDLPPELPRQDKAMDDFGTGRASVADPDPDTARRLAARLSRAMRESCGLPVAAMPAGTRRLAFEQALRQGDEERGQAIACFAAPGGDIGAMMILSPGLAQVLIEAACGARLRTGAVRPLSQIDLAVLEAIVSPLAAAISPDLKFVSLESDTVFAASIAPPCEALAADLTLRVQADAFRAQVILAGPLADGLVAALIPAAGLPADPYTDPAGPAGLRGSLPVTLTARVASLAVPLSRLSGLKPGSTLLLGVPADQPVELVTALEGGVRVAEAEIGRRGGRIALRITRRAPKI